MNPAVDLYLAEGCARCSLGGTPACKVHKWPRELAELRRIVLECGLTEERKWGVPCYTFGGKNVLIVSAFVDYASISFFKGSLLPDPGGLLEKPGENSQAARVARFTSLEKVLAWEPDLKTFIFGAVELEKAGARVEFRAKEELVFPEELHQKFAEIPGLQDAFEALTPGRQRGYNLFFSAPKQSQTRTSRIEKWIPAIFEGKGIHD